MNDKIITLAFWFLITVTVPAVILLILALWFGFYDDPNAGEREDTCPETISAPFGAPTNSTPHQRT